MVNSQLLTSINLPCDTLSMDAQNPTQPPPVNPIPSVGTPPVVEIIPPQVDQPQTPPSGKFSLSPKIMLIILVLLIITVVGSGIYLSKGFQPKQVAKSTPTPLPTETSAKAGDPTASWKTYTGKYFSFRYPFDWIVKDNKNPNFISELENITLTKKIPDKNVDQEIIIGVRNNTNKPEFTIESYANKETIIIDGVKGTVSNGYGGAAGIVYKISFIATKNNEEYYLIGNNYLDNSHTEFYQILSTFKFTDAGEYVGKVYWNIPKGSLPAQTESEIKKAFLSFNPNIVFQDGEHLAVAGIEMSTESSIFGFASMEDRDKNNQIIPTDGFEYMLYKNNNVWIIIKLGDSNFCEILIKAPNDIQESRNQYYGCPSK